jgi:hypothetical protein
MTALSETHKVTELGRKSVATEIVTIGDLEGFPKLSLTRLVDVPVPASFAKFLRGYGMLAVDRNCNLRGVKAMFYRVSRHDMGDVVAVELEPVARVNELTDVDTGRPYIRVNMPQSPRLRAKEEIRIVVNEDGEDKVVTKSVQIAETKIVKDRKGNDREVVVYRDNTYWSIEGEMDSAGMETVNNARARKSLAFKALLEAIQSDSPVTESEPTEEVEAFEEG